MTWTIDTALAAMIGVATHQTAIPLIGDLSVNAPDVGAQRLVLSVSADPPFVRARSWAIEAVLPGDTLRIADRDVALNATLLCDLTESLAGTLRLTLSDASGATLAEVAQSVELLAYNQWAASARWRSCCRRS